MLAILGFFIFIILLLLTPLLVLKRFIVYDDMRQPVYFMGKLDRFVRPSVKSQLPKWWVSFITGPFSAANMDRTIRRPSLHLRFIEKTGPPYVTARKKLSMEVNGLDVAGTKIGYFVYFDVEYAPHETFDQFPDETLAVLALDDRERLKRIQIITAEVFEDVLNPVIERSGLANNPEALTSTQLSNKLDILTPTSIEFEQILPELEIQLEERLKRIGFLFLTEAEAMENLLPEDSEIAKLWVELGLGKEPETFLPLRVELWPIIKRLILVEPAVKKQLPSIQVETFRTVFESFADVQMPFKEKQTDDEPKNRAFNWQIQEGTRTDFAPRVDSMTFNAHYLSAWSKFFHVEDEVNKSSSFFRNDYRKPASEDVRVMFDALIDIMIELLNASVNDDLSTAAFALNRANSLLNELNKQIEEKEFSAFPLPNDDKKIITTVIGVWQQLSNDHSAMLGQQSLQVMGPSQRRHLVGQGHYQSKLWKEAWRPVENPYLTGGPVTPPAFIGRGDILHAIAQSLKNNTVHDTPITIILYGHRCMGKTSMLYNLYDYVPADWLVVTLDLVYELETTKNLNDFYFILATAMHLATQQRFGDIVPAPEFAHYYHAQDLSDGARHAFHHFVDEVLAHMPAEASIILGLDEYEALETAVQAGILPVQIYSLIHSLVNHARIHVIASGLHQLEEMSDAYQHALVGTNGIFSNIKVSYLPPPLSQTLMTDLVTNRTIPPDITYAPDVVAHLHRMTNGHPYMIQRICHDLVTQIAPRIVEEQKKRRPQKVQVGLSDLDAVLDDAFMLKQDRYFDGLWNDQVRPFAMHKRILQSFAHAQANATLSLPELTKQTTLTDQDVWDTLGVLQNRDLVMQVDEGEAWRLRMPIFWVWLRIHLGIGLD
ncbi:MAG: hypothetical protein AAF639_18335 [Chloroflexota bacterium]